MRSQSKCGCVWEHTKEYGDVIVVQCVKHAKRARALADAYFRQWPKVRTYFEKLRDQKKPE